MTIHIHTTIDLPQCGQPPCLSVDDEPTQVRNYQIDPVSDQDLMHSAHHVLETLSVDCAVLGESYFAIGIQSYEYVEGEYTATGPLADLYPADQRHAPQGELTKVGFHNQAMEKPAWTIDHDGERIELLAKRATAVKGATPEDVSWLYVELEDNPWGYSAIIRSHTRGGLAPDTPVATSRVGVGYLTLYTLVKEAKKPNTYHECD